ncbi:hypothetical protein GCM10009630_41610 [Kribbella jejuensis]
MDAPDHGVAAFKCRGRRRTRTYVAGRLLVIDRRVGRVAREDPDRLAPTNEPSYDDRTEPTGAAGNQNHVGRTDDRNAAVIAASTPELLVSSGSR